MTMRSALRLIPLMAIGAAAAFLLAGPLTSLYKSNAVAGRPQPSASATIDPHASPTSCPASLPMPKTATTVTPPAAPALPFPVWVNEPLGAKVRAGASSSTVQLPAQLRPDVAPVADHTTTVQVWSYTPITEQVSRVALNTCKVTSAWARPDQGWPFMSSVYVEKKYTKTHSYLFSFFSADPNSPLVKQVLDSVALS